MIKKGVKLIVPVLSIRSIFSKVVLARIKSQGLDIERDFREISIDLREEYPRIELTYNYNSDDETRS